MTKSQAIKHVRKEVSQLIGCKESGYYFESYCSNVHAWRASITADYWRALDMRSNALIERACDMMDADYIPRYEGGNWTDYVGANNA